MSTPVTSQPLKGDNPAFQRFEVGEFSNGKWNQDVNIVYFQSVTNTGRRTQGRTDVEVK